MERLNDPGIHDRVMGASLAIGAYFEDFQKGVISAGTFASLAAPLIRQVMDFVQAQERGGIRRIEASAGFESLTTDTSGYHSESWFRATGKPFATGVAASCLAVAIISPDHGMAAAHVNPVDEDIVVRSMVRSSYGQIGEFGPLMTNAGLMVGLEDLPGVVKKTLTWAVDEFGKLPGTEGKLPPNGSSVTLVGLDFTTPQIHPLLIGSVQGVLTGAAKNKGVVGNPDYLSYQLEVFTGAPGGIIYGGSTHPRLSRPSRYFLS